jgi:hypothetical protein
LANNEALQCRRTGGINWGVVGVYGLEFNESGVCNKVIHRPSGATVEPPDHVRILKNFVLECNWSDLSASCNLKPSNYNLAALFADNVGPNVHTLLTPQNKEFDRIANRLKTQMDRDSKSASSAPETEVKFREEAKMQSKRQNMLKARAALDAKKKELNNKRKITL